MRITLFDNLDSFTWNLAHDLGRLGARVNVVREGMWSDQMWDSTDGLVLSPGPGLPNEHPQLMLVLAEAISRGVPILGVCLGMQAIAEHFGGALRNLPEPLHGRASEIAWEALPSQSSGWQTLWTGMPSPMVVGHYHSWVLDESSLPACLQVNARNGSGLIMAVVHGSLPIAGVQFHPESVLTPQGRNLLQLWLEAAQRSLSISASNVSLNFS
ncbi:MAG: aminodeoxychorismate/anthranilate synthase component II [Bacteroidetes bacterium]|nr:aminodeoxychorismate/anthranilate synthase component II [Bacteroidota bacterium]